MAIGDDNNQQRGFRLGLPFGRKPTEKPAEKTPQASSGDYKHPVGYEAADPRLVQQNYRE